MGKLLYTEVRVWSIMDFVVGSGEWLQSGTVANNIYKIN